MLRICSLLAILAAAASIAGAGSAVAVGQNPPQIPTIPGVPGVPSGKTSYLFHAEFGLEYEVKWVHTTGDRLATCSYWTDNRGTNNVIAGSVTWIPGQLSISKKPGTGFLVDLVATGARRQGSTVPANAVADVKRRLVQRGGTTPGCAPPGPPPFTTPTNDCGDRKYKTRFATLRVALVRGTTSLERLTERSAVGSVPVIAITAVPARSLLFRKCQTSGAASEFPLTIRPFDLAALRNLKPGERYRFGRDLSGPCTDDLPEDATCYFTLEIEVTIRRWTPGTAYP